MERTTRERQTFRRRRDAAIVIPRLADRLHRARLAEGGQSLVEYALMIPLLLILVVNLVNFGGLLYSWITVADAARAGAQYAAMGGAYAGYPATATLASIKALVQNETSALPNASSTNPVVTVCENLSGTSVNRGTSSTACPAGTNPPQDPESVGGTSTSTYTSLAIDVTYTYTAFVSSGLKFPALDLFTLAMPSVIHTRTVMRVLN